MEKAGERERGQERSRKRETEGERDKERDRVGEKNREWGREWEIKKICIVEEDRARKERQIGENWRARGWFLSEGNISHSINFPHSENSKIHVWVNCYNIQKIEVHFSNPLITWSWKVPTRGSNQGPKLLKKMTFVFLTISEPFSEQKSIIFRSTRDRRVGCSESHRTPD